MENNNIVRFNEGYLRKMVRESVEKVLNEIGNTNYIMRINEDIDYNAELDDEMMVWKERDNEEFSQIIKSIDDYFRTIISTEEDEYGMKGTPISHLRTIYALDGNKDVIVKKLYGILENYDMLQEPKIRKSMQILKKLAAQDNMNESKNEVTRITLDDIKEAIYHTTKAIIENRNSLNEDFYYGDGEVDESTFDSMGMTEKKSELQKHNEKNKKEKEHDSERKKEKNKREPNNGRKNQKRRIVINYLKQDGVDVAPFAYELWPDKDEDSGRSLFYKCLDGKTYNGSTYRFNDSDINKLYSMISSQSV